ncbi:MAG: chorismate mutase [Sporolactobacillus sp.]
MERSLAELRRQVDSIDTQLLDLLNQRGCLVRLIGEAKEELAMKGRDQTRETRILQKIQSVNHGPYRTKDLQELFQKIFLMSLDLQQEK